MKTGWTGEPPDDEGPAAPGGFAGFLAAHRQDPAEGRTLEAVLARAHRDRDPGPEPRDQDEAAANLLARGYSPGALSQLSARLAETTAELAAEREKLEADAKWNERVQRAHANGQMTATDVARSWTVRDEGDPARAERLERRAASLRRQLADAAAVISPDREQPSDPLEAASRHAHRQFVEVTRQRMADAAAGRAPRAPRPFASGVAVRSEVTCPECITAGASPDESFLLHSDPSPVLLPEEEAGRGERWPVRYGREITRACG